MTIQKKAAFSLILSVFFLLLIIGLVFAGAFNFIENTGFYSLAFPIKAAAFFLLFLIIFLIMFFVIDIKTKSILRSSRRDRVSVSGKRNFNQKGLLRAAENLRTVNNVILERDGLHFINKSEIYRFLNKGEKLNSDFKQLVESVVVNPDF